jgi:hypothetical protein
MERAPVAERHHPMTLKAAAEINANNARVSCHPSKGYTIWHGVFSAAPLEAHAGIVHPLVMSWRMNSFMMNQAKKSKAGHLRRRGGMLLQRRRPTHPC